MCKLKILVVNGMPSSIPVLIAASSSVHTTIYIYITIAEIEITASSTGHFPNKD